MYIYLSKKKSSKDWEHHIPLKIFEGLKICFQELFIQAYKIKVHEGLVSSFEFIIASWLLVLTLLVYISDFLEFF